MRRVLVVEDEHPLRRILTLNLARHGYTVAEADTAASAIESLHTAVRAQAPFDLILLDINLPDQSGWDILRTLNAQRRARPDQPGGSPAVIVMTAVRPQERRLREFRPAALLLKPFPIDALLRLIERVMAPSTSLAMGAQEDESKDEVEHG